MKVAARKIHASVRRILLVALAGLAPCILPVQAQAPVTAPLRAGFERPPDTAKARCYWWWLNGNTTMDTITRDLKGMKAKGFGGAILVDADGSGQEGNTEAPAGPPIGSPAWTALVVHALAEARQLGLEISLSVTSRGNVGIIGGPSVTPPDTLKLLTFSRIVVEGGGAKNVQLAAPPQEHGFYRPIATLAYPLRHGAALPGSADSGRPAIVDLRFKAAVAETGFSMPSSDQVMRDAASTRDEQDADIGQVVDLSADVDGSGNLAWNFPEGTWEVLRIGYTDTSVRLSDAPDQPLRLPLDVMSATAFDHYWRNAIVPLLDAAKPYIGTSLRYLVTDSWEAGGTNWTEGFREEFQRRRGYDPLPYLPIVAGRILDGRKTSNQFLFDLRRTVAELIAQNYYDRFEDHARKWGLGTHPEAGGPHGAPIDALENFRSPTFPQTEFWVTSGTHRVTDGERFFVKEAASAAHIYGKPFAAGEGPTSMNPAAWSESLSGDVQPTFDHALTEGLNRLFWHEFTSSPAKYGLPGQEYFAGTHLNPNVTWWNQAGPLLLAFNRAQFLMQQGLSVSDLLYFYGDQVPGFVRVKSDDPAHVLPGYDYDVVNEDALLHRMQFDGPDLHTPEGLRYRALALPASRRVSLVALNWMRKFVLQGGVVIGLKPTGPLGLIPPEEQAEFTRIAGEMWSGCEGGDAESRFGKGRIECTANARAALATMGVAPDFLYAMSSEPAAAESAPVFDYIHRTVRGAEIYFVRNTSPQEVQAALSFRIRGRAPELWNPDDGTTVPAAVYTETKNGRTEIPLTFPPLGSVFIVFEQPTASHLLQIERDGSTVFPSIRQGEGVFSNGASGIVAAVPGTYVTVSSQGARQTFVVPAVNSAIKMAWSLSFPPGWGAPESTPVERFDSWTESQNPGIRYFSGTATYRTTLRIGPGLVAPGRQLWLDLGQAREIATVRVNGRLVGTTWRAPYAVRIDKFVKTGDNSVDVMVTNLWPNRLIGDLQPSATEKFTHTNVHAYTKSSPLMPSGILQPITLMLETVHSW
jgi:hypothetical protein